MLWHLITGEYPPQPGGVSDHTRRLAQEFLRAGDDVHVWTSPDPRPPIEDAGVVVHRLPDCFGPRSWPVLGAGLKAAKDQQILVQYVPHMYGYKGMNVGFAAWLRFRAPKYWILFHEVAFSMSRRQSLRYNVLGFVTHLMAKLVAGNAEKIFVTIPSWEARLRSTLRVRMPIRLLPAPSNVESDVDAGPVFEVRRRLLRGADGPLVGHFGTFDIRLRSLLIEVFAEALRRDPQRRAVMIGRNSDKFVQSFGDCHPGLRDRIVACPDLPSRDVAEHLAACDLLVQPYLDGISCRRGSAMAGLALGCPIVTIDGDATEPHWRREKLVELVRLDDREALVAKVDALLASPSERTCLGERGRLYYRNEWSWDVVAAALRSQRRNG